MRTRGGMPKTIEGNCERTMPKHATEYGVETPGMVERSKDRLRRRMQKKHAGRPGTFRSMRERVPSKVYESVETDNAH